MFVWKEARVFFFQKSLMRKLVEKGWRQKWCNRYVRYGLGWWLFQGLSDRSHFRTSATHLSSFYWLESEAIKHEKLVFVFHNFFFFFYLNSMLKTFSNEWKMFLSEQLGVLVVCCGGVFCVFFWFWFGFWFLFCCFFSLPPSIWKVDKTVSQTFLKGKWKDLFCFFLNKKFIKRS